MTNDCFVCPLSRATLYSLSICTRWQACSSDSQSVFISPIFVAPIWSTIRPILWLYGFAQVISFVELNQESMLAVNLVYSSNQRTHLSPEVGPAVVVALASRECQPFYYSLVWQIIGRVWASLHLVAFSLKMMHASSESSLFYPSMDCCLLLFDYFSLCSQFLVNLKTTTFGRAIVSYLNWALLYSRTT